VTSIPAHLGELLARLRYRRGLSLSELASATYVSRSWISNVEAGRRWPTRDWLLEAERLLDAVGQLVPTWEQVQRERTSDAEVRQLVAESVHESELLLAAQPDAADLDRLSESTADLAVAYLSNPARPMLEQASALRRELGRRLVAGAVRPGQLSDLYVALGRVHGVLAYAALDLGIPSAAAKHGQTVWRMGDLSADNNLRAWARGTQSLIARFEHRYVDALAYINDGLPCAGVGTSEIRLLCGAAQCAANMGDGAAAVAYLDRARRARQDAKPDPVAGLFAFSPAKQAYYSASSLMWLTDRRALEAAERNATTAIELWQHEPPEQRSLDDEALAHVYLATARLKLDQVEGAMDAVKPIMALPEERQISWIRNRISELGDLLDGKRFRNAKTAIAARDELRTFRRPDG
jgi:transcriptional regulator with XRE-family HTH domain